VHGSVTPIIIVNVSVTTTSINVILESLPVLTIVSNCSFLRGTSLMTKLANVGGLVLIHCKHIFVSFSL